MPSDYLTLAQSERVITARFPTGVCKFTGRKAPLFTWDDIAKECAEYLPGMVRLLSSGGLVWINGADGPHGICLDPSQWAQWEEARNVAHRFFGWGLRPEKVATVGSIARLFLDWTADAQEYKPDAEWLLKGATYGYHDCKPGEYENVRMWDVNGYYFHILRELKTLRFRVRRNGLSPMPLRPDETEKWSHVIDVVKDCKVLRNSLVGVMCGSLERGTAYTRAGCKNGERVRRIHPPGRAGGFRAAGLLVVRCGYEFCRAESLHSGSIYSTIDCVTLCEDREPFVWGSYGFPSSVRYAGQADIRGRGCYRIGLRPTLPYNDVVKMRPDYRHAVAPAPEPIHHYAPHIFGSKGAMLSWHT